VLYIIVNASAGAVIGGWGTAFRCRPPNVGQIFLTWFDDKGC